MSQILLPSNLTQEEIPLIQQRSIEKVDGMVCVLGNV